MNRKLLYAVLALIILLPFGYGFAKGYSFRAPFANLIAFAAGKEYDTGVFLLALMAVLLSVVFVVTSASATTSSNAENHVILHPSDGHRIAEENQQKVMQLQQFPQEVHHEQQSKVRMSLADAGLDMEIT